MHLILINSVLLSAPMRSFEFEMVLASSSLKQCNTDMPLPEIAPCLLTPFLECLSDGSMHSGADAVTFPQGDGCCGVYKAT